MNASVHLNDLLFAEIPKRQDRQPAAVLGIDQHLINSADLAENAVLAGCCRNAEYAADALSRLTAGDFDLEWRQTVFAAMVRLNERGDRISTAALYPLLGSALWDRLAQATEGSWQNQWGDPLPPNPHLHDFVAEVAGWAERRQATAAMLSRIERPKALP